MTNDNPYNSQNIRCQSKYSKLRISCQNFKTEAFADLCLRGEDRINVMLLIRT